MISRSHRFHGLNSLRNIYQVGQTSRSQHLNLRYHLNEKRKTYRCAVVISKKVAKSAVVRNRIRRRIFESLRLYEAKITRPYDIVISVFNSSLIDVPYDQLTKQIENLLKNSGIIDAKP